jgi:hypothetical protein
MERITSACAAARPERRAAATRTQKSLKTRDVAIARPEYQRVYGELQRRMTEAPERMTPSGSGDASIGAADRPGVVLPSMEERREQFRPDRADILDVRTAKETLGRDGDIALTSVRRESLQNSPTVLEAWKCFFEVLI